MMVDTINPNTDQPDDFAEANNAAVPPADTAAAPVDSQPVSGDHYFGGFNKPDEVKINLATGGVSGSEQQATPMNTPIASNEQAPASDSGYSAGFGYANNSMSDATKPVQAPTQEETKLHSSYSSRDSVNTRGILVMAGIFLFLTVVSGGVAYFISGSVGSSKQNVLKSELAGLQKQLDALKEQPTRLTATETTNEDGANVAAGTDAESEVTATPTPTATPSIEVPSTTVSPTTDDGKLGTG